MARLGNENDVDEQTKMLVKEPFVQRIQEFFAMVQDKFKGQPNKYAEFKQLCRAIN